MKANQYSVQWIASLSLVCSVYFLLSCQPSNEKQTIKLSKEDLEKIRDEIIAMGVEDQKYRHIFQTNQITDSQVSSDTSVNKNKLDFLTFNKPLDREGLLKVMHETDAFHSKRLSQIIDSYGWPTRSEFGAEAAEYSFLIIQHADAATQKRYFPLLEKAAKQGEASLRNVAMMKDRILMSEGKPQLYGTQVYGTNNIMSLYPIDDEENVDKRRAEMGLEPLDEYLKYFGIERKKK